MTRTLHCDFCNAVITDRAWDCPTRDFDYDGPRSTLDVGTIVDGSVGSWIACADCVGLVRDGKREALVQRAMRAAAGGIGLPVSAVPESVFKDLRELHGQFWANRMGPAVEIGPAQLALIASDPATFREPR